MITSVFVDKIRFFYTGIHFKLESIINKWKKLKQQYKQHHDKQKRSEVGLKVKRNGNSLKTWIKYVVKGINLHPHVLLIQVYLVKLQVKYFLYLSGGEGPTWYM